MDIRYKLFPYPVLSPFSDDYVSASFIGEVHAAKDFNEIVFHLQAVLDNDELQGLIDKDKAEFVFHIECPQTSYRTILRTREPENFKRVAESKLNGKVSVCSFIVAKENLDNYHNDHFNPDYGNMSFNIEKGRILAIGGQTNVEIIKEVDELTKIPSIFSILRRDTDENIGMQVDINGEKIKLWLSNEDFYNYTATVKMPALQPVFHSMFIMPALIYTFEILKNAGSGIDEYESYRWFQALEKIFAGSNMSFNSETLENIPSYELAQKILDFPVKRALLSLISIGTEDEEA